ncbi:MAG: hypothetical protein HYZ46_06020 [Nitrosomonadales bacterium]|nr:hypothetical protein [Nitrosomonadales bacterium]
MPKFDFSLTTRNGQKVEGIHIYGEDLASAERKLRQMYHNCEITRCQTINVDKEVSQSADIEDILSVICKNN